MTVCDRGRSCKYFIDLKSRKWNKMEEGGGRPRNIAGRKILEGRPEQRNSWRSASLR